MEKITEQDLNDIRWTDISIQRTGKDETVLILMTDDEINAKKIYNFIAQNAFDLKVFVNKDTGIFTLEMEFLNSDYVIGYDTGRTEERYLPLNWLRNGQVKFMSTGYWTGSSTQGRSCKYNESIIPMPSTVSLN